MRGPGREGHDPVRDAATRAGSVRARHCHEIERHEVGTGRFRPLIPTTTVMHMHDCVPSRHETHRPLGGRPSSAGRPPLFTGPDRLSARRRPPCSPTIPTARADDVPGPLRRPPLSTGRGPRSARRRPLSSRNTRVVARDDDSRQPVSTHCPAETHRPWPDDPHRRVRRRTPSARRAKPFARRLMPSAATAPTFRPNASSRRLDSPHPPRGPFPSLLLGTSSRQPRTRVLPRKARAPSST